MKLSVIVPIYNTEKYIDKCINSILTQKFRDFELLLVNDGSTDASDKICSKYAKNDKRIKLLFQNNRGVSSARKLGLKVASGEYISFIDSDDWIDSSFYSEAIRYLDGNRDTDIFVINMRHEGVNNFFKIEQIQKKCKKYNRLEAISEMLSRKNFAWNLCDKVYRYNSIKKNFFSDQLVVGEDLYVNWGIFSNIKYVYQDPKIIYHYRMRNDSVTHKYIYNADHLLIDALYKCIHSKFIEDETINNKIMKYYVRESIKDILLMCLWDDIKYEKKIKYYIKDLCYLEVEKYGLFSSYEKMAVKIILRGYAYLKKIIKWQYKKWINTIKRFCELYSNVYIYGTGVLGRVTQAIFKRESIKFLAYVVSNDQDASYLLDSYKVIKISNISCDSNDTIFFMATNIKYREIIVNNSNIAGYKNIYWSFLCNFI